jgi:hypothetical protein
MLQDDTNVRVSRTMRIGSRFPNIGHSNCADCGYKSTPIGCLIPVAWRPRNPHIRNGALRTARSRRQIVRAALARRRNSRPGCIRLPDA